MASTLSPLEVQVHEQPVCGNRSCATKDCIRGKHSPPPAPVIVQRGCELALFQPAKTGNLDCTFPASIACRLARMTILPSPPAYPARNGSSIRYAPALAESLIAAIFPRLPCSLTFGALMNAFGMVSPIYQFEGWLSALFGRENRTALFAIIFGGVVVLEPILLLGLAAAVARRWAAYCPADFWAAQRDIVRRWFHSVSACGSRTTASICSLVFTLIVPLTQNAARSMTGIALLGDPLWRWVGLPVTRRTAHPAGTSVLDLFGSLHLVRQFAEEDARESAGCEPSCPGRGVCPAARCGRMVDHSTDGYAWHLS